jgi:hypothetical protein
MALLQLATLPTPLPVVAIATAVVAITAMLASPIVPSFQI